MKEHKQSNKWIICRICLKNSDAEMRKIYVASDDATEAEVDTDLVYKIAECGGIQLDPRVDMPDSICAKCLLLLKAALKFRVACQRSQQQLSKLLQLEVPSTASLLVPATEDEEETKASPEPPIENAEYVLKLDAECSFQGSADGESEHAEIGYVMNEDIVEEYIEMQPDQIDFLQDESTENFASDDITYMSQEFEVVRNSDDSMDASAAVEIICAAEDVEERLTSKQRVPLTSEADTCDMLHVENAYKIVSKFSNGGATNKSSQRKRKAAHSVAHTPVKAELNEPYICSHCGNMYPEKAKLTLHMKMHTNERPHECEICHKRFSQTPQLSRHMNSHTGNRPFKCKYCSSCFADPSTCIKHERIHTNVRPYVCETCGKTFAYSNVLKVHIMMHTGEKPYTCGYCGRKFSQLHHRKAHERTHNQEVEVKSEYDHAAIIKLEEMF